MKNVGQRKKILKIWMIAKVGYRHFLGDILRCRIGCTMSMNLSSVIICICIVELRFPVQNAYWLCHTWHKKKLKLWFVVIQRRWESYIPIPIMHTNESAIAWSCKSIRLTNLNPFDSICKVTNVSTLPTSPIIINIVLKTANAFHPGDSKILSFFVDASMAEIASLDLLFSFPLYWSSELHTGTTWKVLGRIYEPYTIYNKL